MSDYALVEGMAVTHPEHGTGEIIELHGNEGYVEFGETGKSTFVLLSELDVDWEFYKDGTSVHK